MKYIELPISRAETPQAPRFGLPGKSWKTRVASVICLLAVCLISPGLLMGQSCSVDWYKIAGGGDTSTGGNFQVSGTVGQSDASGVMTGGNYSVTGGFWSLYAVQTPGAPLLTITCTGNQAVVSWPSSATGWTLQTNANLATPTWGDYLGTVVNNSVTNVITGQNMFFRLKQP